MTATLTAPIPAVRPSPRPRPAPDGARMASALAAASKVILDATIFGEPLPAPAFVICTSVDDEAIVATFASLADMLAWQGRLTAPRVVASSTHTAQVVVEGRIDGRPWRLVGGGRA